MVREGVGEKDFDSMCLWKIGTSIRLPAGDLPDDRDI